MHLIKSFSYTFTSSIVFAITQWLIISLIGHFLGIEKIGFYAFGLSLVIPINIFFNFGVRQIICSEKKIINFYSYFIPIMSFQLLGLLLIFILCYLFYFDYLLLCILIYLVKISETITEITYGLNQRIEKFDRIAYSKIARSTISIVFFIIIMWTTENLYLSILAQCFSLYSCNIFFDYLPLENKNLLHIEKSKIYIIGLPLAIAGLLLSFKNMLPRFLIENDATLESLGVFASITYLISAGGLLITAISQIIIPKVAQNNNYETKRKYIYIGFMLISVNIIISALIITFLGDIVFSLLYGKNMNLTNLEYSFIIFMFVTTYISSYLGYIASALRQLKNQPIIYIINIISMIIVYFLLKYFFTPIESVYLTVILGGIQQTFFLYLLVRKGLKNKVL
ncbi:lipopolysaccharide biosynthesis protein [Proteus mirabilis]|uniref:lipopolysaccharide biosynthesis protein n=1 Tax=Proteus mirabilis TaxID=584 RepID=UPI00162AE4CF|nr:hypothetical protein [Proteus mirabilis]MBB6685645.1 hypothetical protein [Proteus mirabilis]HEK2728003.1 hypothetical protein [Proteus mirabilis]HEK4022091.1 hypothetical protein [Proteus mirabilis]